MELKYTDIGYLYISPEDDCNAIVDAMLATGYNEEFCIADDFSHEFIAKLMEAGFLVMSVRVVDEVYFLLPKLHIIRSALFFENLHIKRSIRRLLSRYELKANVEIDHIIDRCIEKHGNDWLTPPLVDCIKNLHKVDGTTAQKASFGLYRDGKLVAGEFGIVCGKVYTSYSGYYDEPNAGTVQIILAAKWLEEQGFLFFDLGMPLPYKNDLGAVDISPGEFVALFRSACL